MEAAAPNITKVSLELGGKAPAIVMPDADLDLAAKSIFASRVINSGQVCNNAERIYVQESVYDAFLAKITELMKNTKIGDPLTERGLDMRIPSFGHAGDGNLHIYLCRDKDSHEEWLAKTKEIFKKLYDLAEEMGGLVSGEHGIGYAKKEYLYDLCGEDQIQLMRKIKESFDPKLILNPGKVCF